MNFLLEIVNVVASKSSLSAPRFIGVNFTLGMSATAKGGRRSADELKMAKLDAGSFRFAPLVSSVEGWNAVAELEILFMRPSEPGLLIGHGGDLDNRIKTLFDALRMPFANEIPPNDTPGNDEDPFHCLLQDDALVRGFSVSTDRLLTPAKANEVELIIRVTVGSTRKAFSNEQIW